MRLCEWCGKPLSENAHGLRKYHEGDCEHDARIFVNAFYRCRWVPSDVGSHESTWHYLFGRLNEEEAGTMLKDALMPPEWELMEDVIQAFDEEPVTRPDTARLRQLAAIGEELLSLPVNTRWADVPERLRSRITWYMSESTRYWKAHPKELLPRTKRDHDLQTRKKRR